MYNSIEDNSIVDKERQETFGLKEFQEWCNALNIGVRVQKYTEPIENAKAIQEQYVDKDGVSNYPKWVGLLY